MMSNNEIRHPWLDVIMTVTEDLEWPFQSQEESSHQEEGAHVQSDIHMTLPNFDQEMESSFLQLWGSSSASDETPNVSPSEESSVVVSETESTDTSELNSVEQSVRYLSSTTNGALKRSRPVKAKRTDNKKPRKKASRKLRKLPRSKSSLTYTTKNSRDILYGRGGESNAHPGNDYFRKEIEANKWHYHGLADKPEKTEFCRNLVLHFKNQGRRFLEKDTKKKQWYIVDDEVAKRKVSQKLRDAIRAAAIVSSDSDW